MIERTIAVNDFDSSICTCVSIVHERGVVIQVPVNALPGLVESIVNVCAELEGELKEEHNAIPVCSDRRNGVTYQRQSHREYNLEQEIRTLHSFNTQEQTEPEPAQEEPMQIDPLPDEMPTVKVGGVYEFGVHDQYIEICGPGTDVDVPVTKITWLIDQLKQAREDSITTLRHNAAILMSTRLMHDTPAIVEQRLKKYDALHKQADECDRQANPAPRRREPGIANAAWVNYSTVKDIVTEVVEDIVGDMQGELDELRTQLAESNERADTVESTYCRCEACSDS
jgi:hypothetical protein